MWGWIIGKKKVTFQRKDHKFLCDISEEGEVRYFPPLLCKLNITFSYYDSINVKMWTMLKQRNRTAPRWNRLWNLYREIHSTGLVCYWKKYRSQYIKVLSSYRVYVLLCFSYKLFYAKIVFKTLFSLFFAESQQGCHYPLYYILFTIWTTHVWQNYLHKRLNYLTWDI